MPIILGADDWLHTACKNIYSRYRQQREKYAALRQEQSVSCQSNISVPKVRLMKRHGEISEDDSKPAGLMNSAQRHPARSADA